MLDSAGGARGAVAQPTRARARGRGSRSCSSGACPAIEGTGAGARRPGGRWRPRRGRGRRAVARRSRRDAGRAGGLVRRSAGPIAVLRGVAARLRAGRRRAGSGRGDAPPGAREVSLERAGRAAAAAGGARRDPPARRDAQRRCSTACARSFERERRFVADASHELRTPIAVIKTELEGALRAGGHEPQVREALTAALEECDHLAQLAEDLLVWRAPATASCRYGPSRSRCASCSSGCAAASPTAPARSAAQRSRSTPPTGCAFTPTRCACARRSATSSTTRCATARATWCCARVAPATVFAARGGRPRRRASPPTCRARLRALHPRRRAPAPARRHGPRPGDRARDRRGARGQRRDRRGRGRTVRISASRAGLLTRRPSGPSQPAVVASPSHGQADAEEAQHDEEQDQGRSHRRRRRRRAARAGPPSPARPAATTRRPTRRSAGKALDRASAAALAHTGGGEVTETEAGDEEGAYEIEVTRADGSQVDVHLDEGFNVLGSVGDDDGADDHDVAGDD